MVALQVRWSKFIIRANRRQFTLSFSYKRSKYFLVILSGNFYINIDILKNDHIDFVIYIFKNDRTNIELVIASFRRKKDEDEICKKIFPVNCHS